MPRLDFRGLKCPLPALLARRALKRAPAGEAIEVLADDPLAPVDVPHMCREEGIEIVEIDRQDLCTRFVLRRPAPANPG